MNRVRGLTAAEAALAHGLFGAAIDTARVRIHAGAWWLRWPDSAAVWGNGIYFPPTQCPPDFGRGTASMQAWLVHELVHVWQGQRGFPLVFGAICLGARGGYWQRRGYRYPPLHTVAHLGCLNMEQQADLVAHYFLASRHRHPQYRPQLTEYRRLLRPLWQHPHNHRLLPRL